MGEHRAQLRAIERKWLDCECNYARSKHEWGQPGNMRGRIYDSNLRRFITPDPFVTEPLNPHGLNRFAYVQNSPLSFVDPSGFQQGGPPEYQGGGASGGGTSNQGNGSSQSNGSDGVPLDSNGSPANHNSGYYTADQGG